MKLEYLLSLIVSLIIAGVIFWYILSINGVALAGEISAIIVICVISGLIIGTLHGKGLVVDIENGSKISLSSKNQLPFGFSYERTPKLVKFTYHRKKYAKKSYEQEKFLDNSYQRKSFREK
ncbi:MAG: hypothetical protein GF308_15595 [Candidatus Heimdallarchaeota archaeon]|nr:hypothetical protein [Candidatus Heimdallarchaeota archaeon]